MKRIVCTLLALVLVLGCMFTMAACTGDNELKPKETQKQKPEIPAGYTEYENGTISFAYPKNWTVQDGSITILSDAATGNNITVVYEAKTDLYEGMTEDMFNTMLKPTLEAAGMAVSGVQINKVTANNLSVVKITYNAAIAGMVSMQQTLYIATIGESTYTVTVTEVAKDATLVATVQDTLYGLK